MAACPSSSTFDVAWAQSLVGKDWEIYWEESGGKDDPGTEHDHHHHHSSATEIGSATDTFSPPQWRVSCAIQQQQQQQHQEAAMLEQKPTPVECPVVVEVRNGTTELTTSAKSMGIKNEPEQNQDQQAANDDGGEESSDEEDDDVDVTDWYDAHVIRFNEQDTNFQVRFVGDDDTVYSMKLSPGMVRPSIRAWTKRTVAMLEKAPSRGTDYDSWVSTLPVDTASLQDHGALAELSRKTSHAHQQDSNASSRTTAVESNERRDIARLRVVVLSQIYLRSRLAPILDSGSDGPAYSDAYLDHLVKCLEEIVQLCEWYEGCWSVHEQLLGSTAGSSPQSPPITVDYIHEACIERGRDGIVSLLYMDYSRAGAKKRRAPVSIAPSPARNPKRRKVYKASEFLQSRGEGRDIGWYEEEHCKALKSVKQFISRVELAESQWFVRSLLQMLEMMSSEVQEPIRTWIRRAEGLLGVGHDSDGCDESNAGDHEMNESNSIDIDNEEDSDDDASREADNERFVSYGDVEVCLNDAVSDAFLERVDLTKWTAKLKQKLEGIETFETEGWKIISQVADDVSQYTKASDDSVLSSLKEMNEGATTTNHYVQNVDPLGRGSSRLTRTVIVNAIAIRQWILDLKHVQLTRERVSFVQDVVSRAPMLPYVPAPSSNGIPISSRLEEAMGRIQGLSSSLYSYVSAFNRFESMVAENGNNDLHSLDRVTAALEDLAATPVLSLVEEKLSIRYDLLTWLTSARDALPGKRESVEYDVVEGLKQELDSILGGVSASRSKRLCGVIKNPKIESEIRVFAKAEVAQFCAKEAARVEQLFLNGREWKERADAIILALRVHGNLTAGTPVDSNKPVAMVDLRRIDDLLAEYEEIGSKLDERREVLVAVRDESKKWSSDVVGVVMEDKDDILYRLTLARDERPKGVVMDPARHLIDSWIEILEWHGRVVAAFCELATRSESLSNGPDSAAGDSFSALLAADIHPLMMEGLEIVALFGRDLTLAGRYSPSLADVGEIISGMQKTRKVNRMILAEKLETNHLGKLILSRIVDSNRDRERGAPLLCLLFLTWRISVINLIDRESVVQGEPPAEVERRPTLEEANELNARRPCLSMSDYQSEKATGGELSSFQNILSSIQTTEVSRFEQLISDAERVQQHARTALSSIKDITRGSFRKKEEVCNLLHELKQVQTDFKSRMQRRSGLLLSTFLEQSLDSAVKDLSWLVRTLPYVALHSDEIPDESEASACSDDENRPDGANSATVPWDVLVNLHERLPNEDNDGLSGDIARVALRVKELFDVAKSWQDEVTTHLSLSFRGARRRAPAGAQDSHVESPRIDLARLAVLARHPILARVSMPRETAVQQVLNRAREFEELLVELLDSDFEGSLADNAPYPESRSLVGGDGEFLLYRLTGSALYESLKKYLRRISSAADELLADTPGKVAFDWIVKAVAWIDELNGSVTNTSSLVSNSGANKLVISADDANTIVQHGSDLFLEITGELRQTLATHKITLSTNKQTERLTVMIAKGGALHSLAGTAIKWCPLLLDWLKQDVARLRALESRTVQTAQSFQAMCTAAPTLEDRVGCYRWLQYRERFHALLDEGSSLVICPRKSLFVSLLRMQSALDSWLNNLASNSQGTSATIDVTNLLRERYQDGTLAVEDRFSVLDALLSRRRLNEVMGKRKDASNTRAGLGSVPTGSTFRDKARSTLENAMRRGAQMMDIGDANDPKSEASTFCALKAWEIEEALFARFRKEPGSTLVSDRYRDQIRTLRFNLEDTKNPTLCPRVLVGDIKVGRLVAMSSEEMASQKVRKTRARAQEEGKRNVIVAGSAKTEGRNPSTSSLVRTSLQSPTAAENSPSGRKELLKSSQDRNPLRSPPSSGRPLASIPPPPFTSHTDVAAPVSADKDAPSSASNTSHSPNFGRSTLKTSSLVPAQIPPPSMNVSTPSAAAAIIPPTWSAASEAQRPGGRYVKTASGGDTFSISVNSTFVFKAKLEVSEADRDTVDHILSEKLTERGRVEVDEFSRFLKKKLSTGRSVAILMRVSPESRQSTSAYKKFRDSYEREKRRIAMFKVGAEGRLYLVTPEFHRAAKNLILEDRSSTYAVLLTRR